VFKTAGQQEAKAMRIIKSSHAGVLGLLCVALILLLTPPQSSSTTPMIRANFSGPFLPLLGLLRL
jgi:hypothetical protein